MKKLFKVALVAVSMLFVGNFASAQTKIAHINFQEIMGLMPETKTVQTQLEVYSKGFTDELTRLQTELQTKGDDYQKNSATMTDAIRTSRQAELQDLNTRYQAYNTKAQQQYQDKANELYKPVADKVKAAIAALAKEKGYGYVIDDSQTALLISPAADDLMAATKLKLGLK